MILCIHPVKCVFYSFFKKKPQYKIKTIQDLVSLKASDRHNLLHFLEDEKYEDVMAVLGSFPHITMDIKPQGKWYSLSSLIIWIVPADFK